MDIIHWISIFFDWIQIRRLLQMDVMAWFIIRIPCWYTMQTITDGWYDMIYNSDTMWYTMQTILFLRITLWFSFLDWLKPESRKFGRFWMIRCGKGIVPSDSLVPDDLEYFPPEMSYCGLIIKMQEIILCKSVWCGLGNTVCRIHFKLYAAIFRFELI